MKKMNYKVVFIVLFILNLMGCTPKQNQTKNYLLCNDTSYDNMAEIESGFFYLYEKLLYYADKNDMTNWVPVCNKADCKHSNASNSTCNAYVGFEIAQKGEKIYFVNSNDKASSNNFFISQNICINELLIDGSGYKTVYEIPFGDGAYPITYRALISSHSLIIKYIFFNENGMYQNNIARLEEDGTLYNMYAKTTEELIGDVFMSSSVHYIRGDEGIISSDLALAYTDKTGLGVQDVMWRMEGEKPELVEFPDNINKGWSYLSGDILIDYQGSEGTEKGYYQYNLKTGEKILLGKAKQENAWGYIMTDNCVVESNRFINQAPEDAYLRIYYDKEWMDVPLPNIVTNKQLERTAFLPVSVASDRIFFVQSDNGDEGYSCRLYYVMLNDETPELTYCTTFGSESYFEIKEETESTESSKENDWIDLDMTVFDTEEYFIKVTGAGLDEKEKNTYKITMHCENKTSDKELHFALQDGAINGMSVFLAAGITLEKEESKEHNIYITKSQAQYAGISDVYTIDEYTDISFLIYDTWDKNVQNIVHVYPKGEEHATSYVRESQPTDEILIDNEYVTVTIIGYESNAIANDTVNLLIENKSDTIIAWARMGIPTINGIEAKQYREENGYRDHLVPVGVKNRVLPKNCAYASLDLRSAFLEENQVTNIESWEMIFKIWYGKTWDEELVNDILTITP